MLSCSKRNHGAARSLGRAGAGYGLAAPQLGEGAWLCSMVFAQSSSKVVQSPPHAAGVILFGQNLTIFVHLALCFVSASQLATLGNFFFCNFLLKDFEIFFFSPGTILQWKNPIFQLPLCMASDRAPSPKPTATRPQKLFSKKQLKGKKRAPTKISFSFYILRKHVNYPAPNSSQNMVVMLQI